MAKEPKKLNLKSKIDEVNRITEEVIPVKTEEKVIERTKKTPKKLNLTSKIEKETSKKEDKVKSTSIIETEKKESIVKELIQTVEEYKEKKEEQVEEVIKEDVIIFPSEEEACSIEEDKSSAENVVETVETVEEEVIEKISFDEIISEEKDTDIIEDAVIEDAVIEDADEVVTDEIIKLEVKKESINESDIINEEKDDKHEENKASNSKLELDNNTIALLQAAALNNINNTPVRKRKNNNSEMEVEIAQNLNNDSKVDEKDNLLDKMYQFTHGLTDEDIIAKTFGEILTEVLKDEDVTDINFNGKDVFIQNNKKGRYLFTHLVEQRTVENFVKDVCNSLNEEFNTENPIIDCEIRDAYSQKHNKVLRLNAVHSSISPYGTTMSIRITQPSLRLTEDDKKFATTEIFKLLEAMIRGNLNILISGRTGSGKTELQKFLIKNIRDVETIVLIEDTKDTNLKELYPEKNITSWITNDRIKNPIDFDALIKASLRNNPDWIIISETRSSEAYSMIKSGLSGHKIITTLHSDSAETNVDRLIHMCKEKYDLDQLLLGQMITSVFDVGVHIDYDVTSEGIVRYVCEIVEYKGYDESGVEVNKIFEVALQPVKGEDGKFTYQKVYKYGKLSEELFSKLAKKKVLTPEIARFIKEEYYGKEI